MADARISLKRISIVGDEADPIYSVTFSARYPDGRDHELDVLTKSDGLGAAVVDAARDAAGGFSQLAAAFRDYADRREH